MRFFTNAVARGDDIFLREIVDGKRERRVVPATPYLFVRSDEPAATYKTVHGLAVKRVDFNSVAAARDFLQSSRSRVYGMTRWVYPFLNDEYPGEVAFDSSLIVTAYLDIETDSSDGFGDPEDPTKEVTAITMVVGDQVLTFGCGEYSSYTYVRCGSEEELLTKFLDAWEDEAPDIVSGWNIDGYDIPYLVNRITRVLGARAARRLSPWGRLEKRRVVIRGQEREVHSPLGIAVLDYMRLYRKLLPTTSRESYALNFIAQEELGEGKLEYSEYQNLADLFKRDYAKFIEYNVRDTLLVQKLEKKLGLIEITLALAYRTKINYEDVFTSVRPWDAMIHTYLMERGIVVPTGPKSGKERELIGGYVKDPKPGMYDWVASVDVASEYPHCIMQFNIGHDSYRNNILEHDSVDSVDKWVNELVSNGFDEEWVDVLGKLGDSMAGSGALYDAEKPGFLAEIMRGIFDERARHVRREDNMRLTGASDAEVAREHNLQMALKVLMNSGFGCISNEHFRWFEHTHAEAITASGRLVIKWAERYINAALNESIGTRDVDYVIAIDTDSMFLNMGPLVKKVLGVNPDRKRALNFVDDVCKEWVEPHLEAAFEDLARMTNTKNHIRMKRETICERAIWTGAKNYVLRVLDEKGVRRDEPKVTIKGIKLFKPSTPAVCRAKGREALEAIFAGDRRALDRMVEEFREEFKGMRMEDIALPIRISGLEKYFDDATLFKPGTPMQVKGAILYNTMLRQLDVRNFSPIFEGEKGRYCMLRIPNPTMQNVITILNALPEQFGLDKYVDHGAMFRRTFMDPLLSIMIAVGWEEGERGTLGSLFG